MKILSQISLLLIAFFIIASCNKEKTFPPDYPGTFPPTDTIPQDTVPEAFAIKDIVMYEVNLRAFSSTGDIPGIINRLDELESLGVNVIWLMPIHPIGTINSVNSPYSVRDYLAVSPEYGTLDDLINLTNEAHTRNMFVIMDWVANHTAWDNPWINNTSWYTQDGSGNIISPPGTNWLDVADLNFSNADMRLAMIDAMKYWITTANIDGYRCDYADGVPYDFWKQAIDSLKAIPEKDLIFLAEGNRSDHFTAGFDLNYGWNYYGTIKDVFDGQAATQIYQTHTNEYNAIPAGKHKLRFTTNHDESAWDATPMELFNGKDGALAASAVTIFLGGVPMIYTGQEVGRQNTVPFFTNSPINWSENPDMLEAYKNMIAFYSASEAAKQGGITNYSNVDVVCLKKSYNTEEILVIVNIRDNQIDFVLPAELSNTTWKDAISGDDIPLEVSLALSNYKYLLLHK